MAPATILSIIVDLFLVGLVAAGIVVGIVRGFLKSVMKPVRIAASLGLSAICSEFVSKVITVPIIQAPLNNKIQSYILEFVNEKYPEKDFPTLVKLAAALADVDLSDPTLVNELVDKVTAPIVDIIALAITFGILFLIFVLIIRLGCWMLESVIKDTELNKINKAAGAVLNGILGFVIGWVFVIVFDLFVHLPMFEAGWLGTEFKGGWIYRLLLNFSPIELLLSF